MFNARQETGMKELLFGGPSTSDRSRRAEVQQRQQQYAAELHAQMAAKEQQRQRERAHSLRQSATLLQLRQQAPSAVLPVFNPSMNQPRVATLHEAAPAQLHCGLAGGRAHAQMPGSAWGGAPPAPPGYPAGNQPLVAQQDAQHWAGDQPPDWQAMVGGEPPEWHRAAALAQWNAQDAETLATDSRRRSWLDPHAAAPPLDLQAPSAAAMHGYAGQLPPPLPLPFVPSNSRGSGRPALTALGAGEGAALQREAEQRKRAAYQADLAAQMQMKQERQRQEKEAEQAADARRGREAQAMQQRAAAGSYGGGSGPFRGVDGRVITDLNKVRQFQAQAQTSIHTEGASQYREAARDAGSIPAHWNIDAGASDTSGWAAGATASAPQQHQLRQPQQLHQQQQQQGQQTSWPGAEQQLQPTFHQPPPGWHPETQSQQQSHHAPADNLIQPSSQLEAPQAQHAGSASLAALAAVGHTGGSRGAALPAAALGFGSQQVALRMRSDRPHASAAEDEARAARQADFKAGLEKQMQDRARQRAEELQRRKGEDAAEEARLAQEQDRLRQQFAEEQAKQRAKQAEKQERGGHVSESGDVTIKFKPPPAAKRRQQQQQSGGGAADEATSRRGLSADAACASQPIVVPGSEGGVGESTVPVATRAVASAAVEPPQQPGTAAAQGSGDVPAGVGHDSNFERQLSAPVPNPATAPAYDHQRQPAPPVLPPLMPAWLAPPGPQMAASVMPAHQPWGLPPLQAAQGPASMPPWMQHAAYPYGQPVPLIEPHPWTASHAPSQFPFTPQLASYQQQPHWLQQQHQQQPAPWLQQQPPPPQQQQQQQRQVHGGGPVPLHLPPPWVSPPQQPYAPASLPLFQTSGVLSVRDSHADGLPVPSEPRLQEEEKAAEEPMSGTSTLLYSPKPKAPPQAAKQQQQELNVLGQPVPALRQRAPQLPALVQPSPPQQSVPVRRRFSWRRSGGTPAAADTMPAVAAAPTPSAPVAGALTLWDDLLHDRPTGGPWD